MATCTAHFYDPATGLFTGKGYQGPASEVAANTPPDLAAFIGAVPWPHAQRVDVDGRLVDHQPPAPSPEHEWVAARRRWELSAAAVAATRADQDARATILATEGASARAVREALLEVLPRNSAARVLLQQADDAIASLRSSLKRE